MTSSCQDIRRDLIECIKLSGCLRDSSFHSCLKSDELKSECKLLRTAYFECRRGQVLWYFSYLGSINYYRSAGYAQKNAR